MGYYFEDCWSKAEAATACGHRDLRVDGGLRFGLAASFADLWQSIQAVDAVLAEVAAEFDGADPIRPAKRETLEAVRGRMLGLAKELTFLEVEIEQREPDEELLDMIRKMVSYSTMS